ncbi:trypsin-like peptidase domain-containing protein [Variovorax sp. J22P240]|uniref:S1C family serine protease n=1 Tax=unclassified Variovorax TaxID=663243 RepID=UPI00257644E1|nr:MULTISPECIES: trypsin-like peptidase domain-containing protein [unclassified Variovorax]MDM0000836.1 trypsin-like peptidase domain-containing protein [Variovorax sp. J22P240]MDM0050025.1 trypsin-like peptidase domain-containing protein [Variovorax sp. J22R115]
MRRPAFYSRSPRGPQDAAEPGAPDTSGAPDTPAVPAAVAAPRWQPGRRSFGLLLALVLAMGATGVVMWPRQGTHTLTQKDIDSAVLRTLQTATLPSPAAKAADIIRPSVVRVVGYGTEKTTPEAKTEKRGRNLAKGKPPEAPPEVAAPGQQVERGVGTGVVIVDKGIILTNLHVVAGAETVKVTFADGLEAPAIVTGVQPENDLAVLQAQKLPDDLIPATMRSTADLQPGDQVVAVGFPFGIGPSVSAGVVSGLKRSFRSPEGKQELGNLIQFDAAANPGNSGGPLINMNGEVLGIVTAILNPTQQRTFIGIGFAVPIENAATAAGSPPF